jgi:hypothetical protein
MANTLELGNGKWATGKDTVLAFNDQNNNFKPLPFSFSRASSATVVNKDGLIETVGSGEPRIDFKDNTKGALLLEPQRSNLLPYSEDFNVVNWVKLGTAFTITSNNAISPSGELNASTINVTNNDNILYESISLSSSSTDWVFSIYAKGSGTFDMNIRLNSSTISTETKTLTNEWQRFNVSATRTPTITSVECFMELNTSSTYQIYGAQLEEGSYPTSYIPTSGGAVTRVAESSSQTVPDGIYGTNEVTFVIDFEINGDTLTYSSIFNTNKNTASSFGVTRQEENGRLKPFLFSSGVNVGDMTSTTAFLNGVRGKFAVGYKNGDSVLVVKGNVEDTNSATFSDFNVNEIHLNDLVTFFGYHTNLKIYDFKLYNTRLSNSELQALTQ